MNQIKACQQSLETTVRGVTADDQSQGALCRNGARRGVGQTVDFIDEDGAGGMGQNVGQGCRLFADLTDRQNRLVEADQDGDGGKDGQQRKKRDAARLEHDVTPPTAGEGANRQLAPEQGQGCHSGLWIQARGLSRRQSDRLTSFGVRRYPLWTSLNL